MRDLRFAPEHIRSERNSEPVLYHTNLVYIENMSDSKFIVTNKSHTTNVSVTGNDNQVVTNSRNIQINNTKNPKQKQNWLQILYWVVGIVLTSIGIYKFFITD